MLVPLIAMQFTSEVAWDLADFVFLGTLLLGIGGAYEFLARKTGSIAYRLAVGLTLAGIFFLVWLNAAVGIIGTERNDANLMFGGVIVIGVIGAIIARFQAAGMAKTLVAMGLAQLLVAAVVLIGGLGLTGPAWPTDVLGLTGVFTALWFASALLFRRATPVAGSSCRMRIMPRRGNNAR
ncbi:MAG: hypothetical protein ABIO86_21690 [Sphingomonas sp.]